jgi:hypothetical protein
VNIPGKILVIDPSAEASWGFARFGQRVHEPKYRTSSTALETSVWLHGGPSSMYHMLEHL